MLHKESLNRDGQQFHQYQQIKQSTTSHLKPLNTKKDNDVWHWKSRSWIGTGTKMWQG